MAAVASTSANHAGGYVTGQKHVTIGFHISVIVLVRKPYGRCPGDIEILRSSDLDIEIFGFENL